METWVGFCISYQYPHADIYPLFVRADLTRVDGGSHGEGISLQTFEGQPALQLSRRSNRLNPENGHRGAQSDQGDRMAENTVGGAVSLRLPRELSSRLVAHLFRCDGTEHGAVIGASTLRTSRGYRLLARQLFLAIDGVDYLPSQRGHRMLTADFVRRLRGQVRRSRARLSGGTQTILARIGSPFPALT